MEFSQMLHECILDGLRNIIGESGTEAVIFNIELGCYVNDPREVHADLYAIFKEGAFSLEKAIIKELFRRLNLIYDEKSSFDFPRCVSQARGHLKRTRKEDCKRPEARKPQLQIIKPPWSNNPTQTSFVVVDLSISSEYPQNFVCIFPEHLFRRNLQGKLRKSKFFRIFGEKSYDVAANLLEDALKTETDRDAKMKISTILKEVRELSTCENGRPVRASLKNIAIKQKTASESAQKM